MAPEAMGATPPFSDARAAPATPTARQGAAADGLVAPAYYADVVTCTAACDIVLNCNADQSLPRRFLPRGTTSRAVPGQVRLMIILANPGPPNADEDRVYRARPDASAIASAAWTFTAEILEGRAHFSLTLDKVIEEAAFLLDCDPLRVLEQCVVTNHVKCSTPKPFSEYRKGAELAQRRRVSSTCVERFLRREIAYWKPRKVVAFSANARDALDRAGIPYDGEISHPTARGDNLNREVRRAKLTALKTILGF